jgi:hypothetical protein
MVDEQYYLFEAMAAMGSKRVAVVIGRFNPPTLGHYAIFNKVKSVLRANSKFDLDVIPVVIVIGGSKSDADKSRNPLSVDDRIMFMQASGHADGITFMSAKNAYAALANLRNSDLEPIAIAAGSDRIADYKRILDDNFKDPKGEKIRHHTITLQRDEDSGVELNAQDKNDALDTLLDELKKTGKIDIDLISGSLARRAVELNRLEEFSIITGLKSKPVLAKKMFGKIQTSLRGS